MELIEGKQIAGGTPFFGYKGTYKIIVQLDKSIDLANPTKPSEWYFCVEKRNGGFVYHSSYDKQSYHSKEACANAAEVWADLRE